jgi:hypothetical protein
MFVESQTRTGRAPVVLAAFLVAATVGLFLAYTHDRAEVWLSAPLDDTFIHFQYAKQLARGEFLRFNDGDPPTTGATSPLYLLLLAPGWLLGFRELSLLIWAWIVNSGLHLVGGVSVFGTVNRLTGRRALAYTALCTYLLSGPLLWGVYSHMEVGLFSTMVMLTLSEAVREDLEPGRALRTRRLLLFGGLLALVRPEGLLMAGGLSLWLAWRHVLEVDDKTTTRGIIRRLPARIWSGRWLLLPLGVGVLVLLLYLLLTGRIATNAAVKSHLRHLADEPGFYITKSFNWLSMTVQIVLEKWPPLIQPLTTLLTLGGLAFWSARGRLRRPGAGALVLGWFLLLTLFYALFIARRDHLDRYYLPYFGLSLVCIWWALGRIAAWLADQTSSLARGPAVVSALIVFLLLPQTRNWANRYGDNCRDLAVQHFKVARWVAKKTPPSARIAVNDAGAIPYLSERYTYDIVGLAHNSFYKRKNHMPHNQTAPVWEALETLAVRPDYMVAYPEWIPDLHHLLPFEVVERFPVKNRTIVANETKIVWRLRWDRLVDPRRPPPPPKGASLKLVDRLDVADLASEHAHDYRRLDTGRPEGAVYQQLVDHGKRALIDGGRHVSSGEEFTMRAHRGKAAVLLVRTTGPAPLEIKVFVDGRAAGLLRARPPIYGFGQPPFLIAAGLIKNDPVRIRTETKVEYTAYHYWLMQ